MARLGSLFAVIGALGAFVVYLAIALIAEGDICRSSSFRPDCVLVGGQIGLVDIAPPP